MPPAGVRQIARWKPFIQCDVTDQPAARKTTLNQIVTEDVVVREPSFKRGFKCLQVVDALPDEASFTEDVLVYVADLVGIRINPRIARKHPAVRAASSLGNGHRDSGLQDRITMRNAASSLMKARPVQRMGHAANQLLSRIARQLSIRIERNHKPDGHQVPDVSDDHTEGIRSAPAQQSIEIG